MLCWCSVDVLLMRCWRSVDTHFVVQWYQHTRYCLYRLPILWLWINAVAQPLDYTRCNTRNRWRSVDAHFQTGAVTMSPSHLQRTAAYMLIMGLCRSRAIGFHMMQLPKALTLCCHSVDTLLMLCWRSVDVLLMRCWHSDDAHFEVQQYRHTRYCLYRLPILRLWINAIAQPLDYTRCNTQNRWRSVDAHFQCGAVTMSRSLLLRTAANTLIMDTCHSRALGLYTMRCPKSLTLCWHSVDAVMMLCWRSVDALLTLCWSSVDAHLVV